MKTLIIILSLSFTCVCQNWSPMKVGNHWQYFVSSYGPDQYNGYLLDEKKIDTDTVINNNYYYQFKYYLQNNWLRYDNLSGIECFNYLDSNYSIMNFNLNAGSQFYHTEIYQGNVLASILATVIEGQYISGDSTFLYKGYSTFQDYGGDFARDSTKYIQEIGLISKYHEMYHGGSIRTLVQALIQTDSNQIYFKQFYYPTIIFEPDTITNSNIFNEEVTVKHTFSRLDHSSIWGWREGVNFIDSVYIVSFYSKADSIFNNPIQLASRIPVSYKYKFNFLLDTTLMKQGYTFNYKLKAVDKFWQPNYTYLPVNDYFTLKYNNTTNADNDFLNIYNFKLYQNYPNPFNPSTNIQYALASRQFISLKIFNSLGEEVETLVNEYKEAGAHSKVYVVNSSLPSGVYYYQLKAGEFIQSKKMLFLK